MDNQGRNFYSEKVNKAFTNQKESDTMNFPDTDKGNLPSRILGLSGGPIGGVMTRRLVEMGERELLKK